MPEQRRAAENASRYTNIELDLNPVAEANAVIG